MGVVAVPFLGQLQPMTLTSLVRSVHLQPSDMNEKRQGGSLPLAESLADCHLV